MHTIFDGTETVVYMFICASKDAQMHKCTVSRIRWNSLSLSDLFLSLEHFIYTELIISQIFLNHPYGGLRFLARKYFGP